VDLGIVRRPQQWMARRHFCEGCLCLTHDAFHFRQHCQGQQRKQQQQQQQSSAQWKTCGSELLVEAWQRPYDGCAAAASPQSRTIPWPCRR